MKKPTFFVSDLLELTFLVEAFFGTAFALTGAAFLVAGAFAWAFLVTLGVTDLAGVFVVVLVSAFFALGTLFVVGFLFYIVRAFKFLRHKNEKTRGTSLALVARVFLVPDADLAGSFGVFAIFLFYFVVSSCSIPAVTILPPFLAFQLL